MRFFSSLVATTVLLGALSNGILADTHSHKAIESSQKSDTLSQSAIDKIKTVIEGFERGLKERNADLACADLLEEVLFVNQRGRSFVGKSAVVDRHRIVLAPGGPLESKPPAVYTVEKIFGSDTDGNARVLVAWKYPTHDSAGKPVAFTTIDPQEGFFIFNFLRKNREWKIASVQNTPTLN